MKKNNLFCLGLKISLLFFLSACQKPFHFSTCTKHYLKKNGFVRLNDTVWVGKREVSCSDYMGAFWQGLCSRKMTLRNQILFTCDYEPLLDRFGGTTFGVYQISTEPITGMSYKDAYLYCQRQENFFKEKKLRIKKVRLLYEKEWKNLNSNQKYVSKTAPVVCLEYFGDLATKTDSIVKVLFNRRKGSDSRSPIQDPWEWVYTDAYWFGILMEELEKNPPLPTSTWEFYKKRKKFYTESETKMFICGNVSEMLMEKGFVVGGSFKDSLKYCTPDYKEYYDDKKGGNYYIGFRVAVVLSK